MTQTGSLQGWDKRAGAYPSLSMTTEQAEQARGQRFGRRAEHEFALRRHRGVSGSRPPLPLALREFSPFAFPTAPELALAGSRGADGHPPLSLQRCAAWLPPRPGAPLSWPSPRLAGTAGWHAGAAVAGTTLPTCDGLGTFVHGAPPPKRICLPPLPTPPTPAPAQDLSASEAVAATTRSYQAAEDSVSKANKVVSELRPALAKAEKDAKRLEALRATMKRAVDCAKKFQQNVEKDADPCDG